MTNRDISASLASLNLFEACRLLSQVPDKFLLVLQTTFLQSRSLLLDCIGSSAGPHLNSGMPCPICLPCKRWYVYQRVIGAVKSSQVCSYSRFCVQIVRDKKTKKSKGFGFVSFTDGLDFAKAMREMQGKYIGNRPCKLTKSSWDERNAPPKRKGEGQHSGNTSKRQR